MQRKIKLFLLLIPIIAFAQISKAQNHCTCTDTVHHLYYRHDSLCNGVEKLPWHYQIGATTITVQPNGNVSNNGDVHGSKETTYKNGKRVKVVTYFADNKIEEVRNYNSNNQIDGLDSVYEEDNTDKYGNPVQKVIYELSQEFIYKNGKIIHKKDYGHNGQGSESYDEIDSNRIQTNWYNNNQKQFETTNKPGGIIIEKEWTNTGQLLLEDSLNRNGLVNRLACNDSLGKPLKIGTFKNGNGILLHYSVSDYYGHSYVIGENINNTDKVISSETYKNGENNGLAVFYYNYPTDTSSAYNYKDGLLNGKYFEYFKNHKKKTSGFYRNDKENGIKREYNESGELIFETTYVDGKQVSEKNILAEKYNELHKSTVNDKKRIAVINSFLNSLKTNYNPDSIRFKYYCPKILSILYSKYLAFSKRDTSLIYQQQQIDLSLENYWTKNLSDSLKGSKYIVLNCKTAKMKYPSIDSCEEDSFSLVNSYYSSMYVIVFENKHCYRYILMRDNKIQDLFIHPDDNDNILGLIVDLGTYGYNYRDNFWDDSVKIPLILKKKDIPK